MEEWRINEDLLEGSRKNELDKVKSALENGGEINCRGSFDFTPLMFASGYGKSRGF